MRPWQASKQEPLVPPKVVDVPKQRFFITALFLLLQSAKIMSAHTFQSFALYTVCDLLFVLILPLLSIQWLTFNKQFIFLQIATAVFVNYTWFISLTPLFTVLWVAFQPVVFIAKILGVTKSQSENGLITGSYTVEILPEAFAQLDAVHPLCADGQPVYLQLHLNNSWPATVILGKSQINNLDESKYTQLSFSKRDLAKFPMDSKTNNIYLPVESEGMYFLDRIIDNDSGLRVKIMRKPVVVPPCPSAKLVNLSPPVCDHSEVRGRLEVHGYESVDVEYEDNDGLHSIKLGNEPLKVMSMTTELAQVANRDQKNMLVIRKLKDSFGNEQLLNLNTKFEVIPSTHASLMGGSMAMLNEGDVLSAQIEILGTDAPFEVTMSTPKGLQTLNFNKPGIHKVQLDAPGEYTLESCKGNQCGASHGGQINVFIPPQVNLENKFETVEDKCAGPRGLDAKMWFTGTAPFTVGYKQFRNNKKISEKTTTFQDKHGLLRFRPTEPGVYTYQLTSIADKYRHTSLTGDQFSFSQELQSLPGAKLDKIKQTKYCGNDSVIIGVNVSGKSQYILHYYIDTPQNMFKTAVNSDKIELNLDLDSGDHFVALVSLVDLNGCVTDLGNQRTPQISVRKMPAKIKLTNIGHFKSVEPVNQILNLAAEHLTYPARLVYEHILNHKSTHHQIQLGGPEMTIPANAPGEYKLVSLDDGVCGGAVDTDSVTISLYERPKLELLTQTGGTCLNSEIEAQIALIGEAPFTIVHETVDPSGKSLVKSQQTKQNELKLTLPASSVGVYEHFIWVMDKLYPEINRQEYNLNFKHEIYGSPNAQFAKSYDLVDCEGYLKLQPLRVLTTKPNCTLSYSIDKEVRTLQIEGSEIDLSLDLPQLTPGSHKVKLLSVVDGNSCAAKVQGEAKIRIKQGPVFNPPNQRTDYCIGDHVSLPLGSTVDLEYLFNNRKYSLKQVSKFERYMNTPGLVNLVSLTNKDGCTTFVQHNMTIHSLPKSTITEQPHFSIYEGEQIKLGFAFVGEPPFNFVIGRFVDDKLVESKVINDVWTMEHDLYVEEGGEYKMLELSDKYCKSSRK